MKRKMMATEEKSAFRWLVAFLLLLLAFGSAVFFYGARQHALSPRPHSPDQAKQVFPHHKAA